MPRRLVFVLPTLLLMAACGGSAPAGEPPPPEAPAEATVAAPSAAASGSGGLVLGDWKTYPEPPGEDLDPETVEPLDDDRWARVSAELACAGRVERGDPSAHGSAARRVLHHHKTTAKAVMDYGIAINVDPTRATTLGERVAAAAERCR
jgi:hypothetical protein